MGRATVLGVLAVVAVLGVGFVFANPFNVQGFNGFDVAGLISMLMSKGVSISEDGVVDFGAVTCDDLAPWGVTSCDPDSNSLTLADGRRLVARSRRLNRPRVYHTLCSGDIPDDMKSCVLADLGMSNIPPALLVGCVKTSRDPSVCTGSATPENCAACAQLVQEGIGGLNVLGVGALAGFSSMAQPSQHTTSYGSRASYGGSASTYNNPGYYNPGANINHGWSTGGVGTVGGGSVGTVGGAGGTFIGGGGGYNPSYPSVPSTGGLTPTQMQQLLQFANRIRTR